MRRAPILSSEPVVSVSLLTDAEQIRFALTGEFRTPDGRIVPPGRYRATPHSAGIEIRDAQERLVGIAATFSLSPMNPAMAVFTLEDVPIGKGFHWERKATRSYAGTLTIRVSPSISETSRRLMVMNEIPAETYLKSVISSEMSARAPVEFLKAHAVVSRSWLLAQLARRANEGESPPPPSEHEAHETPELEIRRWANRTAHREFDVCADDHCQRYYGLSPVRSDAVMAAVAETHGQVLTFNGHVCDARFSKCCGGATEAYRSAWEDRDVPYLRGGQFDGAEWPADFPHPLTIEAHATTWIMGFPPAHCRVTNSRGLDDLLPEIDRPTRDFFRWERMLEQEELHALVKARLGLDLGAIRRLEPLERGASSRLVRLRIVGERRSVVVGKELEIRRVLSWTCLYSSAFVIFPEDVRGGIPRRFRLRGAGWGHGVGLCQIGAAIMAQQGRTYQEILAHYYAPAEIALAYT